MIDIHVFKQGDQYSMKLSYDGAFANELTSDQMQKASYFTRKCDLSSFVIRNKYTIYDTKRQSFSDGRVFNPYSNVNQILDSFNSLSNEELKYAIRIIKIAVDNSKFKGYNMFFGTLRAK